MSKIKVHNTVYNIVYFDGHAKMRTFGAKWTTLPASGWPPENAPI